MQTRTPQEIKKKNADIALRHPITKQYFRHPILASDGKRYELENLLGWISSGQLRSPSTTMLLTHAAYDKQFQQKIQTLIRDDKIKMKSILTMMQTSH